MQRLLSIVLTGLYLAAPTLAQTPAKFRARLSTVPIDIPMQATVAGSGSVTATLASSTLTLNGSFEGLRSPATIARIHVGPKGISGPAAHELKVSGGTSGTIAGTVTLTPQQIEDLKNSRLYIQLHSEKAPEGNLRGWLLPQEARP